MKKITTEFNAHSYDKLATKNIGMKVKNDHCSKFSNLSSWKEA